MIVSMGWGLSLSGGGVKGAAHVGALTALEEEGLAPALIGGTSAGAIVAGLYASGMDAPALTDTINYMRHVGTGWLDYDLQGILKSALELALHKPVTLSGLVKGNKLEKYFELKTHGIDLKQARLPVCLTAADINNARLVLFSSRRITGVPPYVRVVTDAPIHQGIRASIAMPVAFQPMTDTGVRLVDGGVWENIPVYPLYNMGATHVIAVNVGYYGQPSPQVDNLFEIGAQSLSLMGYELSRLRARAADLVINVPMGDIGVFSFERMEEAMERGYATVRAAMEDIKHALAATRARDRTRVRHVK